MVYYLSWGFPTKKCSATFITVYFLSVGWYQALDCPRHLYSHQLDLDTRHGGCSPVIRVALYLINFFLIQNKVANILTAAYKILVLLSHGMFHTHLIITIQMWRYCSHGCAFKLSDMFYKVCVSVIFLYFLIPYINTLCIFVNNQYCELVNNSLVH